MACKIVYSHENTALVSEKTYNTFSTVAGKLKPGQSCVVQMLTGDRKYWFRTISIHKDYKTFMVSRPQMDY